MESKRKTGFTLIELIVVIAIIGVVTVFVYSIISIFSKSSKLYTDRAMAVQMGNSSIDFIINKLDEAEICLSQYREFKYAGNMIIFKIKENAQDINEYGILYFDYEKDELKYVKVIEDEFGDEAFRYENLLAKQVRAFSAIYNKAVPENSNFVVFNITMYYETKEEKININFFSGMYLRNVR